MLRFASNTNISLISVSVIELRDNEYMLVEYACPSIPFPSKKLAHSFVKLLQL